MKPHTSWGYEHYKPLFYASGDIYICRIAPFAGGFTFDTKEYPDTAFEVYLRKRSETEFTCVGRMTGRTFTVRELDDATDYAFYVCENGKKSRERLVRTGEGIGDSHVINYLHPDDEIYAFSGRYLCSPSLVRHPDGFLLASMDLYQTRYPQNLTLIFRSDDDGVHWTHLAELFPCFWGKLFIHHGKLYMFGASTEYGDLQIGCSEDGGKTWSAPTVLFRGSGGKNGESGWQCNPEPVVEYQGRIWYTVEWGQWERGYHAPAVLSAPIDADLLNAESWTVTQPVKYDKSWKGLPPGDSTGNIEGTLTVFPDGKLYDVMRYDMTKTTPNGGMAIIYRVDTEHPEEPLTFVRTMDFYANYAKFEILHDKETGAYLTIASRFRDLAHAHCRNLLSLMYSYDMVTWHVACDIYDKSDEDPQKIGFQYVDYFMENEDILFQCRVGWYGAASFHDANYAVFDRIVNFRRLLKKENDCPKK